MWLRHSGSGHEPIKNRIVLGQDEPGANVFPGGYVYCSIAVSYVHSSGRPRICTSRLPAN